MSVALLLAVACTLEIDFGPPKQEEQWNRECQVMWAILDAHAVESFQQLEPVVRAYIAGLDCEDKKCDTPRAKMIRSMNLAGMEPVGWDRKAGDWNERYRDRWMRRLRRAEQFAELVRERDFRGSGKQFFPKGVPHSCWFARSFGGACAATGACDKVPACWHLANCGNTQQAYWIPAHCGANAGTIDAKTAAARRD